ncbi:MAG: hypothetical protein Fur005_40360 [Roseiflexaceae bacterium]
MPTVPYHRSIGLLSAVMLAALIGVMTGAFQRFNPTWQPNWLIGMCFLIALEANLIHRLTRRERMSLGERLRFLAPELLVLVILMRLVASLSLPEPSLRVLAERWLYDPISVVEPFFVLYVVIGIIIGVLAHSAAGDIAMLGLFAGDTQAYRSDGGERFAAVLSAERGEALARLSSRFMTGGILLIASLSLEAANIRNLGGSPEPISQQSTVAALIYIIAGFLVQSHARLAMLQSRWALEGATVAPSVARQWGLGAFLIVGSVLAIAALLPRSYGMGLLDALRNTLGVIGYAIAFAGYLITYFFGMLLLLPAYLLSLLMPSSSGAMPIEPAAPPALPPQVPQEAELQPAILFWVCIALLSIFAVGVVQRRHPRLLRHWGIALVRLWRGVVRLFRSMARWVAIASNSVIVQIGGESAPAKSARQRLLLRLGSPSEQIIGYYRDTVERAAQVGITRIRGQTPSEYQQALGSRLPPAASDMAELTNAYIRARYAPLAPQHTDAQHARGPWQRLRRLLRKERSA